MATTPPAADPGPQFDWTPPGAPTPRAPKVPPERVAAAFRHFEASPDPVAEYQRLRPAMEAAGFDLAPFDRYSAAMRAHPQIAGHGPEGASRGLAAAIPEQALAGFERAAGSAGRTLGEIAEAPLPGYLHAGPAQQALGGVGRIASAFGPRGTPASRAGNVALGMLGATAPLAGVGLAADAARVGGGLLEAASRPAALGAGARLAAALAGGYGGGRAAEAGARALGAGPQGQELAGQAGGLAGALLGERALGRPLPPEYLRPLRQPAPAALPPAPEPSALPQGAPPAGLPEGLRAGFAVPPNGGAVPVPGFPPRPIEPEYYAPGEPLPRRALPAPARAGFAGGENAPPVEVPAVPVPPPTQRPPAGRNRLEATGRGLETGLAASGAQPPAAAAPAGLSPAAAEAVRQAVAGAARGRRPVTAAPVAALAREVREQGRALLRARAEAARARADAALARRGMGNGTAAERFAHEPPPGWRERMAAPPERAALAGVPTAAPPPPPIRPPTRGELQVLAPAPAAAQAPPEAPGAAIAAPAAPEPPAVPAAPLRPAERVLHALREQFATLSPAARRQVIQAEDELRREGRLSPGSERAVRLIGRRHGVSEVPATAAGERAAAAAALRGEREAEEARQLDAIERATGYRPPPAMLRSLPPADLIERSGLGPQFGAAMRAAAEGREPGAEAGPFAAEIHRELRSEHGPEAGRAALRQLATESAINEERLRAAAARPKPAPAPRAPAEPFDEEKFLASLPGPRRPQQEAEAEAAPAAAPAPPPTAQAPRPGDEAPVAPRPGIVGANGDATRVLTPGGDLPASYRVVPLASLVPSHQPGTFAANPEYPAGVQERDYMGSKEAQARVIEHAQKFEPAHLVNDSPAATSGPPVITSGGVVLGGNSRAMTLRRIAGTPAWDDYQRALRASLGRFGLTEADIAGIENPVLVRQLRAANPATVGAMRRIVSDLNRDFTAQMSEAELAASRGQQIGGATIARLGEMLDADPAKSLRDLMRERPREIVELLSADGIITAPERPRYVDPGSGELNAAGKDLVERALLGSVVADAPTIAAAPPSSLNRVTSALAPLHRLKAAGGEWDISADLAEALRAKARQAADGLTTEELLGQANLFGGELKPHVEALVRALDLTPREFRARLRRFAAASRLTAGGQTTLTPAPSPEDAFHDAFGFFIERGGGEPAASFRRAAPPGEPEHSPRLDEHGRNRPLTPAEAAARRRARFNPAQSSIFGEEHERELAAKAEALGKGKRGAPDDRQGTLFRAAGPAAPEAAGERFLEPFRHLDFYHFEPEGAVSHAEAERLLADPKAAADAQAVADALGRVLDALEIDARRSVVLDPAVHGVHLHDFRGGGRLIAVNPFSAAGTPEERAAETFQTIVHEAAHASGYSGHDAAFANALADVYTKIPKETRREIEDELERTFARSGPRPDIAVRGRPGRPLSRGAAAGGGPAYRLSDAARPGASAGVVGGGGGGAGAGVRARVAAAVRGLPAAARAAYHALPERMRVVLGQFRGQQDPLLAERYPALAEAARLARVARAAVVPTTESVIARLFGEFTPEELDRAGHRLLAARQAEEAWRAANAAFASGDREAAGRGADLASAWESRAEAAGAALGAREREIVARYQRLNREVLRPLAVDAGLDERQLYDDYYHYVFRDFNDRLAKAQARGKGSVTLGGGRRVYVATPGPARKSTSRGAGAETDPVRSARGALNELRGRKVINDFVRHTVSGYGRRLDGTDGPPRLTREERGAGKVVWQPTGSFPGFPFRGLAPAYALDREVADMLNDFAHRPDHFGTAATWMANQLAYWIKVGRVGFSFLGLPHQLNLFLNPLMEGGRPSVVPGRDAGARWRIASAQFDHRLGGELRRQGPDHPDVRELVRLGAMDPWQQTIAQPTPKEIATRGAVLNPRVGHDRLFALAGPDAKTRVQALREYRLAHPERAANGRIKDAWTRDAYRYIVKQAGDYNSANYSQGQKYAAPFVAFFGWDKVTYPNALTWPLRHPAEAGGLYLATRLVSHALGGNWLWTRPATVAVGQDREGREIDVQLPSQLGKTARVAGAAAELLGGHPERAARTAFNATSPLAQMPAEAVANQRFPLTGSPRPVLDPSATGAARARDLAGWIGRNVFGPYAATEQAGEGRQTPLMSAASLAGIYAYQRPPLADLRARVAALSDAEEGMIAEERRGEGTGDYAARIPGFLGAAEGALVESARGYARRPPADPAARDAARAKLAAEARQISRLGAEWEANALADALRRGDREAARQVLARAAALGLPPPSEASLEGAYRRMVARR